MLNERRILVGRYLLRIRVWPWGTEAAWYRCGRRVDEGDVWED